MTFEEACRFVHATGNFTRAGLERIRRLMEILGNPQEKLKFVHVAGTNGKGSTCAMLASVLQEAGYKTGLYISPHLVRITERMQINGVEISENDFAEAAQRVSEAVEQLEENPTEFERLTAMAFCWFAGQQCDIVVLEVGLGGRFDATNVISAPEVSVICAIGLDHTQWLGDTPEKIAFEKGGIIKSGRPAVLLHQSAAVEQVIRDICVERGCQLTISGSAQLLRQTVDGQQLNYGRYRGLRVGLIGRYQGKNASTMLETLEILKENGWTIPDEAVYRGMERVHWPARLEVLQKEPLILLDGAHNPNGVQALTESLKSWLPGQKWTFVMGVMADKDYRTMLGFIAPLAFCLVATQPDYYRALSSAQLREAIDSGYDIPVFDGGPLPQALKLAGEKAQGQPICIFGSLYQAGEVRSCFSRQ